MTWIWNEICCDLVRVYFDLSLAEHEWLRHFDCGCPWNVSCAVDSVFVKMTLIWPAFACLETGFERMNIVGALLREKKMVNVCDRLADSCSLHESEIGISCGYQVGTGVDYHRGLRSETESVIVLRRLRTTD